MLQQQNQLATEPNLLLTIALDHRWKLVTNIDLKKPKVSHRKKGETEIKKLEENRRSQAAFKSRQEKCDP